MDCVWLQASSSIAGLTAFEGPVLVQRESAHDLCWWIEGSISFRKLLEVMKWFGRISFCKVYPSLCKPLGMRMAVFLPTTCFFLFPHCPASWRNCSLWEIQRSWLTQEQNCLQQWWFKNLLSKQVFVILWSTNTWGLFAGAKQLWHCSTGTVSWHHFWSRNAYTSTILDGVNSFLETWWF